MPKIMLQMISLVFQRIIVFILDFPAGPPAIDNDILPQLRLGVSNLLILTAFQTAYLGLQPVSGF